MTILHAEQVTMRFGGVVAVDGVDWQAESGEIHGIIGPNGAGKTTLFNIMAGALTPTAGRVLLMVRDITGLSPERRCGLGIARTFQIPRPFGGLTVRDNVAVAALPKARSVEHARRRADEVLEYLEMSVHTHKVAGSLSIGLRKRLEVARALATTPKIMLLDEVMGGLHGDEVQQMIGLIRRINKDSISIVMIEHVMAAVMALAERVTVLDQGRIIASGTPSEVTKDPAVIAAYLGDEVVA